MSVARNSWLVQILEEEGIRECSWTFNLQMYRSLSTLGNVRDITDANPFKASNEKIWLTCIFMFFRPKLYLQLFYRVASKP